MPAVTRRTVKLLDEPLRLSAMNDALEDLRALAVALDDAHVDAHRVAGLEVFDAGVALEFEQV